MRFADSFPAEYPVSHGTINPVSSKWAHELCLEKLDPAAGVASGQGPGTINSASFGWDNRLIVNLQFLTLMIAVGHSSAAIVLPPARTVFIKYLVACFAEAP